MPLWVLGLVMVALGSGVDMRDPGLRVAAAADPPTREASPKEGRAAAAGGGGQEAQGGQGGRADRMMQVMREREAQMARREEAEWGPEQNGLRLRGYDAPSTLRIGDAFSLGVGVRGNAATLPEGRDLIDLDEFADSLTVELVSVQMPSPIRLVLQPERDLLPSFRRPREPAMLTSMPLGVVQVRFATAPLASRLEEGVYRCTVKAEMRDHARDAVSAGAGEAGNERRKRLWYGTVSSRPIELELFRGEPGTEVAYIPRVLRTAEQRTFFTREDADRVSFTVPKGSWMGVAAQRVVFEPDAAGIKRERIVGWGIGGDYFKPGDTGVGPPPPVGSAIRLRYFSTNEPVGHLWNPAAGSAYKVLLERLIPVIGEKDEEPGRAQAR